MPDNTSDSTPAQPELTTQTVWPTAMLMRQAHVLVGPEFDAALALLRHELASGHPSDALAYSRQLTDALFQATGYLSDAHKREAFERGFRSGRAAAHLTEPASQSVDEPVPGSRWDMRDWCAEVATTIAQLRESQDAPATTSTDTISD